jgi:hypothetical protein
VKPGETLKLAREVRDLQIVDADDRRCGMVDDLELEGEPGGALAIRSLLTGPGALTHRLPGWARWLLLVTAGTRLHRIPWSEVEEVTLVVKLKKPASAYGLLRVERRLSRALARLPQVKE